MDPREETLSKVSFGRCRFVAVVRVARGAGRTERSYDMTYANTHRHENVVLAGNGPVLFHSIPAPEAAYGLAAEQREILLRAAREDGSVLGRTARTRRQGFLGRAGQGLRARMLPLARLAAMAALSIRRGVAGRSAG